jgi:hypothetical protein
MSGMNYTPDSSVTAHSDVVSEANFKYTIRGDVISIVDLDLGCKSVTNDMENVLRRIEYYHQGSIARFSIIYRDSKGIWDQVNWDGEQVSFSPLDKTDQKRARDKLCQRPRA